VVQEISPRCCKTCDSFEVKVDDMLNFLLLINTMFH